MSLPARQQVSGRMETAPQLRIFPAAGEPLPASAETFRPLEWNAELQAEVEAKNQELETASPQEILRWSVARFAPQFTMATAFGPEGMAILEMLSRISPKKFPR